MRLKEWRLAREMTLGEMAAILGIESARTYQRYEDGENRADAHIVEKIIVATTSTVDAYDMHAQRLEWLKAHREDLFQEASVNE